MCCGGGIVSLASCSQTTISGGGFGPEPAPEAPDAGGPPSPFQPSFGATVKAATPPPAISGGTLIVSKDGTRAFAADSDRDAVYAISLATSSVTTVTLRAGDEPGRLAEDGAGMVHVALRGSGSIVTIDPTAGTVTNRQAVCPAPRGVAWDSTTDLVWVACATGEVVALPSTGGTAVHSYVLERDLRDVIVNAGTVSVTQFRSANVLRLGSDGTVVRRDIPSGTLAVVHQEEQTDPVTTQAQGGYGGCGGGGFPVEGSSSGFGGSSSGSGGFTGAFGVDAGIVPPGMPVADDGGVAEDAAPSLDDGAAVGSGDAGPPPISLPEGGSMVLGCTPSIAMGLVPGFPIGGGSDPEIIPCTANGIVRSDLTLMNGDGNVLASAPIAGTLPVDVAFSADASLVAVALPGNTFMQSLSTVVEIAPCSGSTPIETTVGVDSEPIAVAFDPSNDLLVQTREPAQLWILTQSGSRSSVSLATSSAKDTGHDIFHVQAGGGIACASCHPEGGDDGHVWNFDGDPRRTPSLRGTIAGTAPYHWPGDMKDLPTLVGNVYTVRMSGPVLPTDEATTLEGWVQSIPAPPAPSWVDRTAAARGAVLFASASVGCATCHSGSKLTNNATLDVGTGGSFQVPPLVGVGWRAPFLHTGCATTMADRFGACATQGHGNIGGLSTGDVSDLEAYLETL
jgi:DNA-binding beta-propeller fold protein YncE